MTARVPSPPWLPIALGIVIGLGLAVLIVGGIVAVTLLGPQPAPTAFAVAPPSFAAPASIVPGASSPVGGAPATSSPSSAVPPSIVAGAPAGSPAGQPAASERPPGLTAIVDATLLDVLPATVDGVPLEEYPDAEQQAVLDPDLGLNVARVATAFVANADGSNWAYTAVVEVRAEARSDAFYRGWQTSFDTSACERAGGVTGHTTMVIAGFDVERTACGAGVRTYHVRIPDSGLLISISDIGDARYGELEIAGLRP